MSNRFLGWPVASSSLKGQENRVVSSSTMSRTKGECWKQKTQSTNPWMEEHLPLQLTSRLHTHTRNENKSARGRLFIRIRYCRISLYLRALFYTNLFFSVSLSYSNFEEEGGRRWNGFFSSVHTIEFSLTQNTRGSTLFFFYIFLLLFFGTLVGGAGSSSLCNSILDPNVSNFSWRRFYFIFFPCPPPYLFIFYLFSSVCVLIRLFQYVLTLLYVCTHTRTPKPQPGRTVRWRYRTNYLAKLINNSSLVLGPLKTRGWHTHSHTGKRNEISVDR